MPRFNEKSVVEDYLIDKLEKSGWSSVKADDLGREDLSEALLLKRFVKSVRNINDIELSDADIDGVLGELKLRSTSQEGSKQILSFFRDGVPIKLESDRSLQRIKLFDYEKPERNDFVETRQVTYVGGERQIRPDIMLYVNGIPLVDIECKNPASFSETWFNAYRQIKDYEKTVPELYKFVQIGVAAEQNARYFPIVPWRDEVKTEEWKGSTEDPLDSLVEMLNPKTLLDIVGRFAYVRVEFGEATKVLPRYMQYRATNKIVDRVDSYLKGKIDKNKGLIWHWQGSGKTLEMIYAANKLYRKAELSNPTIFMVVDRQELEEQLYTEFTALDVVTPEIISSVAELKRVIEHDEYRGKRGVFITLIHKFRPEEFASLVKLLEEKEETISSRKNVICFIDEGHRSQYGVLAAQMKSLLKKAFFFAFTGTPISKPKRGVDTYLEFSYPPEEKYLDRYFITDSIGDGFTVKIAYQPRLEKEAHLRKDLLDTFLEIEEEEIPEEIRDEVKEETKKRINLIKIFLENPERIRKTAEDIAQHFKENVDESFKALVVAVSRDACILYKNELDKHLPKNYSEVVFSYTAREKSAKISKFLRDKVDEYCKEYSDVRADVIDKYKEEEYPKILIVTDMLLTGFDAPVLQTMYLDKPLKEHRLLQAVARTNRPYKGVKEAGLVLDYVGVLKELRKALEIYSKEEIKGALYSSEELRSEFREVMDALFEIFKDVPKDRYDRSTLLKATEKLTASEEQGKDFLDGYGKLSRLFELLGPDTIKAELFSEYQWLTAVYIFYTRLVYRQERPIGGYVSKYLKKTIRYVHKTVKVDDIVDSLPLIEFNEEYLKQLEERVKSREEKAADIVFTLNRFVLVEKNKNPVAESLSEKVKRLLDMWREKTKDYEKIYLEGVKLLEEYNERVKRQKDLGLEKEEYSLLLLLEDTLGEDKELVEDSRKLVKQLKEHTFSGWVSQPTAQKNVEKTVRLFLRKYVKKHGLSIDELNDLQERVMNSVKSHAL